jgi:hypothetical protein
MGGIVNGKGSLLRHAFCARIRGFPTVQLAGKSIQLTEVVPERLKPS